MKKSTLIIILLTVFVLVLGVAVVGADDANQITKSTEAVRGPLSGGGGLVPGLFTTDFEAGDGFSPGNCDSQNGWFTTSTNASSNLISTANPAGGTQHLRLNPDPDDFLVFTGCANSNGSGGADLSIDVAIDASGGSDYGIAVIGTSNSGEMRFNWFGNIYVADGSGSVIDTGVPWTPGSYVTARIERTPTDINYYYNGVQIDTYPIFGDAFGTVYIYSDNYTDTIGDFDNLVVENPTAVGLNDLAGANTTNLLPLAVAALLGLLSVAVFVGSKRSNQQKI